MGFGCRPEGNYELQGTILAMHWEDDEIPLETKLPPDPWLLGQDPAGDHYFINSETGESFSEFPGSDWRVMRRCVERWEAAPANGG